jgi:hypothetical protein
MSDIASRNVERKVIALTASRHRRIGPGTSRPNRIGLGVAAMAAALSLAGCSGPAVTAVQTAPAAVQGGDLAPTPKHPLLEIAQLPSLETMSTGALIDRLGKPDFTRHDPPAEIWQYRGSTCVLDVFLYPEEGELKVLHVATRDRDRVEAPENRCTPFGPTSTAAAS